MARRFLRYSQSVTVSYIHPSLIPMPGDGIAEIIGLPKSADPLPLPYPVRRCVCELSICECNRLDVFFHLSHLEWSSRD